MIIFHTSVDININLFEIKNISSKIININFVKWSPGGKIIISGIEADGHAALLPNHKGLTFYLDKYGQCIDILYIEKRPYIIGGYGYQKLI